MTYNEWAARWPQAAAELAQLTTGQAENAPSDLPPFDEAYAQQRVRFLIARAGGLAWRNNVGATPAKVDTICPRCMFHFEQVQRPVRYGLANDSDRLNAVMKSSDLIGIMPRTITADMVGSVIGQFLAVEVKRPGWHYTGAGREKAQNAFLSICASKGALAQFSTGGVRL